MPQLSVALTGATGFIGRRVQAHLVAAGHRVRAIVRPDSKHAHHLEPGCDAFRVHLNDSQGLARALEGVDAVIYCAGSVRGATLDDFVPANVDGIEQTLRALENERPPLLLISSLAATRPELSHYAHSKFLGEQVLREYAGAWTILRPPAVYGPGDREMLPLLRAIRHGYAPITGPAGQRLSLLHVNDLAAAMEAWMERAKACDGQRFAIDDGSDNGYDWPAIIAAVATGPVLRIRLPRRLLSSLAALNSAASRVFGYAPMLSPGKVRELRQESWLCDNTAFSLQTGWQPRISLAEGVDSLFGALS
ncbi:MAG: NAD(P)-dependent oxidoreductase [Pseudomonadota bacterium]